MLKCTNLLLTLTLSCFLGQATLSPADEPKTGEKKDTLLYVRTVPPGAKVLLDGKELGKSDGLFPVDPGVSMIQVELDGCKPDGKRVTIKANQVNRVELTLNPQTGAIPAGQQVLKSPPITAALITKDGISTDQDAWRIEAKQNRTVRLFEIPDPGADDCRVIYRAKLKTENLEGRAYLEMWCRLPGEGESFSKGLQNPVSGTTDWASYEIPFLLKKGQRPDLIKLNLVIEGKGTLWIKNVELGKSPLDPQAGTEFAPAATKDAGPDDGSQNMQKYLADTQEMVRKGKYKEALDRFVWFDEHALEHQPSMVGVRLSFALSSWKSLGDVYPPAKTALVAMRDNKAKQLTDGGGNAMLFLDVFAINQTLDENSKTVDLFQLLDKTHPAMAKQCWSFAKDVVISAKRFDLVRKYIGNPVREFAAVTDEYDRRKSLYDKPDFDAKLKIMCENQFVEKSLQLIEVALALDDRKAAKEIQAKALAILDDHRLRDALPAQSAPAVVLAADEKLASPPAAPSETSVVEGVGWGPIRVGATREELVKVFGPLERTPGGQRMGWRAQHHIDFWFDQDGRAAEVQFSEGFRLPLTSGIKIGSTDKEVLAAYGAPDRTVNNGSAQMFEFDNRGVLLWEVDGKVTSFTVIKSRDAKAQSAPGAATEPDAAKVKIIEGVGFGDVRVGATREEVVKALGKPDNDPSSEWPKWARHHLECGFDKGTGKLYEMHLNPGFQGALANGIKLGSPENTLVDLYGKPEQITENPYGAKMRTYSKKGMLFWTYQGQISQIVIFKPRPGSEPAGAKDDRPAASDAAAERKQTGESTDSILTNPSIETGAGAPDAWQQGAAIPGVKYSWAKTAASDGKASLCIEKTAKNYFPIAQWSQTVDRTGNLPKLEVSAQVKARKMTKAILDVIFYDKQGNSISHQWAAYIGSKQDGDPPADHDWKKYTGTVDIPAGAEKICIALQDYGPGKVWFDDVQAGYAK